MIEAAIKAELTEWLIVVPLPKFVASSHELGYDGITLLAATDLDSWRQIAPQFQYASRWDPNTGIGGTHEPNPADGLAPQTWCLCRAAGSEPAAAQAATARIRTFVAAIFAHAYAISPHARYRMAASPPRRYVQFASAQSRGRTGKSFGILEPPLVPITGATIEVDSLAESVRKWYLRRSEAAQSARHRATVASQFLQFALVSSGIQEFFNFFITLDALFGVQGSFEESILGGVRRVFKDDAAWLSRGRKLIQLRNELVHGGSSSIATWPAYDDYVRHFRSEPLADVAIIATTSLREFFVP
jgi:hypothetical protein